MRTDASLPGIVIHDEYQGLITFGVCAGSPSSLAVAADKFALGCILEDSTTGATYQNGGSVGSPVWLASGDEGMPRAYNVIVGFSNADYICDGVADNVQIQAAIDAVLASGGGTVFVKDGIYDIAATVNLKANVSLIGNGWTTVLKSANSLNSFPLRAQYVNLVTNCAVKDLKVDMNGPNQGSNGWVALTGVTNFTLDHVWFYNSRTFGLLMQPDGDPISGNHCTNCLIQNCRFDTQSGTNDFAIFNIRYSKIVNNYWGRGPSSDHPNYALSAGRSMRYVVIANNVFNDCGQTAIGLEDVQDVQVIGNNITDAASDGILIKTFQTGFNVERVSVIGNIITGSTVDGISVGGGSGDSRIKSSVITGNISYNNGRDGIAIYGADNCTLGENICFNNNQAAYTAPEGSGIRFSGGTPTYNTLSSNKCFDNQGSPTQNYGIYSGNGDNFTFVSSDNEIYGNVTGQLSLSGSANNGFYEVAGKFGFGTSSPPSHEVTVSGTNSSSATTASGDLGFGKANSTKAYFGFRRDSSNNDLFLDRTSGGSDTNVLMFQRSTGYVGFGKTPTSRLDVAGPLSTAYAAKTTTYTITDTDSIIDCTSGTFTVTLPTAVSITGRQYTIKNSGAGTITVATTSSQTIDGSTTYSISTQYVSITVVSDGANWIII